MGVDVVGIPIFGLTEMALGFSGSGVVCSAHWRWSLPEVRPEMVSRSFGD